MNGQLGVRDRVRRMRELRSYKSAKHSSDDSDRNDECAQINSSWMDEFKDARLKGTNEGIVMADVYRIRGGVGSEDEGGNNTGDDATVDSEGERDETIIQDNTLTNHKEAVFGIVDDEGEEEEEGVDEGEEGVQPRQGVAPILTEDEDSPLLLNNKSITSALYAEGSELLTEIADVFANSFVGDGKTTFMNITELRKCREAMKAFLDGWVAKFLKLNEIVHNGKNSKGKSKEGNESQRKKSEIEKEEGRIRSIVALARAGDIGKANSRLHQTGGLITPPNVDFCLAMFPQTASSVTAPVAVSLHRVTRSQQRAPAEEIAYDYCEERDLTFRMFTTDQIKSKILSVRTGSAAGPSGFGCDVLKLLAKGKNGDKNMEGITALFTAIVRGWLPPWARDMLHALRGIAIPKPNGPVGSWRPICISEIVVSLVEMMVGDKILPKCKRLSGGFQMGLKSRGIEQMAMQAQIRFDAGEARGDEDNLLLFHADVKNAYNNMNRPPILKLVVEELSPFGNFFIQAYGKDIDVKFTEEISVKSHRGVIQGRPTSSMIFDAVFGQTLMKHGIDVDSIGLIHDDLFLRGCKRELVDMKKQVVIVNAAMKEIGLEIQPLKTGCLHTGVLGADEKTHIRETLGFERVEFGQGMVIGGIPVGTSEFCSAYVDGKVKEVKDQMDVVATKLVDYPGVAISIVKMCVCPKLIYISRAIPLELWTESALQLCKTLRETLGKILLIDTLDRDQRPGDNEKMEHRLITKVKHGGLGLWDPMRFGDAALVAAYTDNKEEYRDMSNELGEGGNGSRKWMIMNAAGRLRDLLLVQPEGQNRLTWGAGECKVSVQVQKIIGELADGDLLGRAKGSGKTQNVLSDIVDRMHCENYTQTQFGGAKPKLNRIHTTVSGGTAVERAALKQWIGTKHPLSGMFVGILHLEAIRMSPKEIRAAVLTRIGVTSGRDGGICPDCCRKGKRGGGQYDSFDEHAELCRNHDGGCNYSAECHSAILQALAGHQGSPLTWIPKTRVTVGNIPISKYFEVRNQAELSANQLSDIRGLCSDLMLAPRGEELTMIDICTTSVFSGDNAKASGVTGACATRYEEQTKFKKHAKFIDDGKHLTSMGFDSRGGFSKNAMRVLRSIFAPNPRIVWKDDTDRIWLQKRTVAVISAIIHRWAGIRRDRLIDSQMRSLPVLAPQ